jgi:guanine deaminase
MNKEVVYIQRAIHLAKKHSASGLNGPFGAVIVKDEKIVGEGWNQVVSSNDPTAHAEVMAIRDACSHLSTFQLKGCTIYCSCEPCPMCLSAIYWARIEKIVYACTAIDAANVGFDDQFIYEELSRKPADRSIKSEHVLDHNGIEVFQLWEKNQNRIDY